MSSSGSDRFNASLQISRFRARRMPARRALLLLGMLGAVLLGGPAHAFQRSDGETVSCEVDSAGRTLNVPEEYVGNGPVGTIHPALGGSAAVVRRHANGSARMVFDRFVMERIASRSLLAHDLVFYHECAHIRLQTDDEVVANCEAVRHMRAIGYLDDEGYAALTRWHDGMGRVAPRYGGTGKVFWQRTEACLARDTPPQVTGMPEGSGASPGGKP